MKKFLSKVSKPFSGKEKGFTLIELLIVIVILGVLAAAIIPNLSNFVNSGEVGAANAELASVRTGISAYVADNDGDLPAADADAGGVVTEADVETYMTGEVKGVYTCDSTGLITDAANGDWSTNITFNTTDLQWEKS